MGRPNIAKTKYVYDVDMAFVIDATASMKHVIEMVKDNALQFYDQVNTAMQKKHKQIRRLRIRLIVFRDYLADHSDAMMVTDFFELPDESREFKECVQSIVAMGGGDSPEDGLEGLAYAIKSKWSSEKETETGQLIKHRHVIVVWSDAPTHKIGYGRTDKFYPQGMPKDFGELSEWWGYGQTDGYIDQYSKRLVLFVPDEADWNIISKSWDNVVHIKCEAGTGLRNVEYDLVLDMIGNTI